MYILTKNSEAVSSCSLVPRLSLLRAIIPRMTFDPAEKSGVKGHTWNYCAEEGEPGDEAK